MVFKKKKGAQFSEFALEGNNFLLRIKRHAIVEIIIKKYKKEDNFDYFFNQERIDRLSVKIENNWKINLINFDCNPFT